MAVTPYPLFPAAGLLCALGVSSVNSVTKLHPAGFAIFAILVFNKIRDSKSATKRVDPIYWRINLTD